ncbi:MAG: hypothetical protein AB7F31_00465 [Parachlamydiales bacterium]
MSQADKPTVIGAGVVGGLSALLLSRTGSYWGPIAVIAGTGLAAKVALSQDKPGIAGRATMIAFGAVGGALIGGFLGCGWEYGKQALSALQLRNWGSLEDQLYSLVVFGLLGSVGVSSCRTAWGLAGGESWAEERHYHCYYSMPDNHALSFKWAALADGPTCRQWVLSHHMRRRMMKWLQNHREGWNHYPEWLSGAIARHWDHFSQEERSKIIAGALDGSWQLEGGDLYAAFKERGKEEELSNLLCTFHKGEEAEKLLGDYERVQKVAETLPLDKFEEQIAEVEQLRDKGDHRGWAKALQPIAVYHKAMIHPQFKQAVIYLNGKALVEGKKRERPEWEAFWQKWNEQPEVGKSLAHRYQALLGVYDAGPKEDPDFTEYLATLEPPHVTFKKVEVEVTEEEDGLEEAMMALYGQFRPKHDGGLRKYVEPLSQLQQMGLVSEEAVKEKVLKDLPLGAEEKELTILKRLGDLAKESSVSLSSPLPQAESVRDEDAIEAEIFVRIFEGEPGLRLALTGLGFAALSLALNGSFFLERASSYPAALAIGMGMGCWLSYEAAQKVMGPLERLHEGLAQIGNEVDDPMVGTIQRWAQWLDEWLCPQNLLRGYETTFSAHSTFLWGMGTLLLWRVRAGVSRLFGSLGTFVSGGIMGSAITFGGVRQLMGWNRKAEVAREIELAGGAVELWREGWVRAGLTTAFGYEEVQNNPEWVRWYEQQAMRWLI